MICRLLRIIYVVERYRITIDAYIDGVRGDDLRDICAEAFYGCEPSLHPPGGDYSSIWDMIDAANHHIWDVEKFFSDKVSFAGMLP